VFKVLVIDDELSILENFRLYLEKHGYEVVTAPDGLSGFDKFKASSFDLVITDIAMPYISGITLLQVIKDTQPDMPVFVMTGYGEYAEKVAWEKDADLILQKPFQMSEVGKAIKKLLEGAQ
jgi:DNA-binding response OmpR family regulator